jgi:TIR domain
MVRIFISYSTKDSIFVDKLVSDLTSFSTKIFYDKWKIKVGDSIVEKINEALLSHDNLVIILSNNSSIMRQLKNKSIKIKPVLIEECEIPPLLSDIKYADFRLDYQKGFTSLIDSFEEDFDLLPYIALIDSQFPNGKLNYDKRMLSIILKKILPIPFGCLSIIGKINDEGYIFYESIDFSDERIEPILKTLIEDKLIIKDKFDDKVIFKSTNLGKIIIKLLFMGLNEGLIDAPCSH